MYSEDIDFEIVKILKLELDNRKEAFKLVDFNDMIQKFIDRANDLCPTFDVVFIDEAQDLSPIQWKMYDELKKKSKHVVLAGDDDQAIYGWAGADVERFQKEPGKEIVLPKSYRVPQSIQSIANKILDRIPDERRILKTWQPRKETGNIYPESYSLQEIPVQDGNWLILARTNYRLINLMPDLQAMGIYYEYKNKKSFSEKLYKTIINWTRYVKGEELNEAEIRDILEYTEYKTIEEIDKDLRWYELLQLDLDDSLYIRKMLERKEPLSSKPRVKLSTIHAAKGGEADNVLLVLDMSKRTLESLQKSLEKQDEEHRVWYVGVTRAKQNLYFIAGKNKERSYDIESLG
jgi:DNA helicase-2/ATP-dependent DNA helicase PcrA